MSIWKLETGFADCLRCGDGLWPLNLEYHDSGKCLDGCREVWTAFVEIGVFQTAANKADLEDRYKHIGE